MGKIFEDYLSKFQEDIISIALDYVDGKVDGIFIYGACENGTSLFDVFYKINGKIIEKEKLNDALDYDYKIYDTSYERQSALLNHGLNSLDNLEEKCDEFNREMPTEMRLYYDAKNNRLQAKYRYDYIFSDDNDLLPGDVFHAWFDSVSKGESDI
ncbi:hypothetical protein [Flavobacterium collinsii]|uniref:DUF600 domain-containing protein n=1 Tax=Flavobacterium collinsii TaxID=1114861 RepID=A0A9W4XEG5_9FLAO|nr:hypothetical protein [Flavobacterium collinsii]CAI2767149.1 conserved protein of unknown function [Flavobacterium collinsii]